MRVRLELWPIEYERVLSALEAGMYGSLAEATVDILTIDHMEENTYCTSCEELCGEFDFWTLRLHPDSGAVMDVEELESTMGWCPACSPCRAMESPYVVVVKTTKESSIVYTCSECGVEVSPGCIEPSFTHEEACVELPESESPRQCLNGPIPKIRVYRLVWTGLVVLGAFHV